MALTSALDLVNDSQLPVRFSDNLTHHGRQGKEETWEQQRLLGRGGFGSVWLQKRWPDGDGDGGRCKLRAMKRIPKELPGSSESINYAHELLAIAKFSQPKYEDFFIRSFGWYENAKYVFIAMEYIEYGDLGDHLGQPLLENEAQRITGQLLRGLAHMHTNGFTHRDLKPKNIFVVSKGPYWWVKIGDFGVSKRVQGSTALKTVVGTPGYIAPEIREVILDSGDEANFQYTSAVDMWSLGIIVCHLLTGQGPSGENRDLLAYIRSPAKCPPKDLFPNSLEQETHEFLKSLLAAKPDIRLSARDALQHGWLNKSSEQAPELPSQINPQDRPKIDMSSDQNSGFSADNQRLSTLNSAESFQASARWSDLDGSALSTTVSSLQLSDGVAEYNIMNLQDRNRHSTNTIEQGLRALQTIYESGHALQSQRRFEEAEAKFQQAAKGQHTVLGHHHQDTLISIHWLARSLHSQGKYEEAEMRFEQAMEGQEKVLGRYNEETILSILWLGRSLLCQQKCYWANKRFQQAMGRQKKVLGHDHQDTLVSFYLVGRALCCWKKYKEAEMIFQQALEGQEKILWLNHHDTLFSIYWLGHSLYGQGKYKKAGMRFQQAMERQARVLGSNHKETLFSIHWLGRSLYSQKKYREAEMKFQQAVKGRQKVVGHDHQDTLFSIHWLGLSLYFQKKYREATMRFQQAAEGRQKGMGQDHQDTQVSQEWLARSSIELKKDSTKNGWSR